MLSSHLNKYLGVKRTIAIAKSLQSCLTLCDPIDGSPPGPGILQARTLEWVAISFSSGREQALGHSGSVVVARGLSCPKACEIFPN